MILGTVLLVLLIGGGVFGLLKYRATLADDGDAREGGQLTDEMLVALAKELDRREP